MVYVLTHDSIGLGEDGPTHQPIEHAAMLRLTPGIDVWRPCDLLETAVAWCSALEIQGPTALLLSRQKLPQQNHANHTSEIIAKGGYVLWEADSPPQGIFIATGSEVALAVAAAQALEQQGVPTRVVSMPCVERFSAQSVDYRESVLPESLVHRVAVEAGVSGPWYRFVGDRGCVIGIDRFGLSAPAPAAFEALGITTEAIEQAMLQLVRCN